jgi:hypothetical protein
MLKTTRTSNEPVQQLGAFFQPKKSQETSTRLLNLQASTGLLPCKSSLFLILSHGRKSLKNHLLLKTFYTFLGWATLTLDFLLKRLFTPSSAYNDFNNTATIWKPKAVKRGVI